MEIIEDLKYKYLLIIIIFSNILKFCGWSRTITGVLYVSQLAARLYSEQNQHAQ